MECLTLYYNCQVHVHLTSGLEYKKNSTSKIKIVNLKSYFSNTSH